MRHLIFKPLRCLLVLLIPFQVNADIEFRSEGLDVLKKNAGTVGKLYFVNFTAAWCAPCQLMKEYTFTDPGVSYYARKSYLASQVNWDSFDGFDYRQQYNIQSLPAILVFNSKGKLVGKYEESLSATKMLQMLKKHDKPGNRVKVGGSPAPGSGSRPPFVNTKPKKNPTTTTTKGQPTPPSGSGLFLFDVSPKASTGYSVQIGVYAEYGNVLKEVSKFKKMFNEPILVHIDKLANKTVYRVMVGEFSTVADGQRFTKKVKEKGLDSFVKDLSGLK